MTKKYRVKVMMRNFKDQKSNKKFKGKHTVSIFIGIKNIFNIYYNYLVRPALDVAIFFVMMLTMIPNDVNQIFEAQYVSETQNECGLKYH